jgi:hypothetical protein
MAGAATDKQLIKASSLDLEEARGNLLKDGLTPRLMSPN